MACWIVRSLVEFTGLRVPAHLDCNIFNTNGSSFGNHYYFFEVPSRWQACRLHHAHLLSGLPFFAPMLPIVDDEYHEHVAVYHSVLRAVHVFRSQPQRAFVFGELGARWGTWGARAVSLARLIAPSMRSHVYFVELADGSHRYRCLCLHTTLRTLCTSQCAHRLTVDRTGAALCVLRMGCR
jgi:hypothetical protein